ncbi:MAG: hypothetical protein CSA52_01460 [Gammaproteobacteria bacterium]|nr:MAG: hypothetical protein CSB48_13805 [Pseudomonadota bacterium]PIE38687.1 MAG: hypothetical protein CSA52_01460 [Gammaproteobacteria bacterium]
MKENILFAPTKEIAAWAENDFFPIGRVVTDYDELLRLDLQQVGSLYGKFSQEQLSAFIGFGLRVYHLESESRDDTFQDRGERFICYHRGENNEPQQSAIHVLLVSGHIVPNLVPVFDEHDKKGVTGIVLVTTCQMTEAENVIRNLAHDRGIPVYKPWPAHHSKYFGNLERAQDLVKRLRRLYPASPLVLNATGGTKPFSMAYVDAFRHEANARIIYVDTQSRNIERLDTDANTPLPNVLTLREYFDAVNFEVISIESENTEKAEAIEKRARLTRSLAEELPERKGGKKQGIKKASMAGINMLAQIGMDAYRQGQAGIAKLEYAPDGATIALLNQAQQAGLLDKWSNTEWQFSSLDAARYLGGVWLEEFVYLSLGDAVKRWQPEVGAIHLAMGVEGRWHNQKGNSQGVKNEFDICVVFNNQLLLIECKTARFGGQDHGKAGSNKAGNNKVKAQDVVNKLDLFNRAAGSLFGAGWLVSASRLPEHARQRAEINRNVVLDGIDGINHLVAKFDQWIEDTRSKPVPD